MNARSSRIVARPSQAQDWQRETPTPPGLRRGPPHPPDLFARPLWVSGERLMIIVGILGLRSHDVVDYLQDVRRQLLRRTRRGQIFFQLLHF
jgi:hypothetical protein